jgi:glycosyltransferase involved in cell wall biosynthesis
MPQILGGHDVVVVPTLSPEPLARIVMEGMACGLVVIASHTGGSPEMIVNGEDGFLFEPGDSGQLGELLAQLAQVPTLRRRVATRARAKAAAQFDIQRMIDEIEEFLEEVMAQSTQEHA